MSYPPEQPHGPGPQQPWGGPPPQQPYPHQGPTPPGRPPGPPGPQGWQQPPGGYYPPPGPPGPPRRRGSGATWWIIGGAVALVLVLVVGVGAVLLFQAAPGGTGSGAHPGLTAGSAEPGDVDGVQTFDITSTEHVEGTANYDQNPPAGGEHNPVWLNCGVYDTEVTAENAVHSLEHGAVWITYDAGLDQSQVETLRSLYIPGSYVIISPVQGLPAPIVASAWGKQLGVDNAEDTRLLDFLRSYEQGPQTLEPGASCSGAVGEPISE